MKISTKERIINKAIELFNQHGFASVSLFEIAGALGMTRGNLTYHFKDKDILLNAIADELWRKMMAERSKSQQLPSFENLHREIQLYYHTQQTYAFIFLDYHVLNHPAIQAKFRALTEQQIHACESTIAYAVAAGNMQPEPHTGIYHNLAFNTWLVSFYWLNQQMVRGSQVGESEDASTKIWSMLLPHLTAKGMKAFQQYFGVDYIKNLGRPFQPSTHHE